MRLSSFAKPITVLKIRYTRKYPYSDKPVQFNPITTSHSNKGAYAPFVFRSNLPIHPKAGYETSVEATLGGWEGC